jgi:hypothetical protein
MHNKTKISLKLLLLGVADDQDRCVQRLIDILRAKRRDNHGSNSEVELLRVAVAVEELSDHPLAAAAGAAVALHEGSALVAVFNALRLLTYGRSDQPDNASLLANADKDRLAKALTKTNAKSARRGALKQ